MCGVVVEGDPQGWHGRLATSGMTLRWSREERLREQAFQFQQKQPQMHNAACSRRSGDKLPSPSSEWGLHMREQVRRMLSWARHPGGPLRLHLMDMASERDITPRQTLGGSWSVKTPFSSECLHPCAGALYPVSLRSVLQKMLF